MSLLAHIVIARILGPHQYGIYALTLAWVAVLSVCALLGQDNSVLRFLPVYLRQSKWSEVSGLRRGVSGMVLVASLVISAIGAIVVHLMRMQLGSALELSMLVGFVMLPVFTQLQLSGALHRALKRPVSTYLFSNVLRQIALLVVIAAFWVWLHERLNAPIATLASTIAAAIALVFSVWFLVRAWPPAAKGVRSTYEFRTWKVLGIQLFLLSFIGIILNRVDVLLLGGIDGSQTVGPYYAAVQLADVVIFGIASVTTILAPMIAEHFSAGESDALARLVQHAARLIFIVTGMITVVLVACGYWVLGMFGQKFTAAYVPLLIILAGQCVNAVSGPTGYLMSMTHLEREALLIFGGGAVLNILLSVILIPYMGMIGAAIATAFATVAWNLAAVFLIRRRLNINPTIFPLRIT